MSRSQPPRQGPLPPRQAKSPAPTEVCPGGALERPRGDKARIAEAVWRLEAVRGRGDAEVARIGELQRGIVARGQLIACGLSPAAIKHRLQMAQLHVLYPGVYLIGRPRLEPLAAAGAAVTYADGRGVLSHRTAAAVWKLLDGPESPVDLTTVGSRIRSRGGLNVHRASALSTADIGQGSRDPTKPGGGRGHSHPHPLALRAEAHPADHTRRAAAPAGELKVQGLEVDLLWPSHKLVVEFDGFTYHSDRDAFERDRLRDQRLVAAGYRVLRVTARHLDQAPEAVIARIAAALAQ